MTLKTAVLLFCTISMAQDQPSQPKADIILLHGNIYTGVEVPSSFHAMQRVEALAIRGDRVQAAGTESEILKLKGPQTQVINLGGHFVMPGFNDAHLHLASAGFRRLTVDLTGVKSLTEFRDRIRARVQTAEPGEWITGGGWDHTLWPVKELPSRWDIDEVTTDHPVFLQRVDGHITVANTRALQLASITLASKDPEGGKIDRDLTGGPTGILRETARDAVSAVIPKPTREKRRQAIAAALQDLAQWGITSAQDNSGWEDFQVYEQLEREGKLTVRISEWLAFNDSLETLKAHRAAHPVSDNMLHTGMLKGFMDGSLGSRTAALLEPYADDPKNSGLPQYEQARLTAMTKERADLLWPDLNGALARRVPKRAAPSYAWVEFLKKGVTLAFGTDYPVEPVTPFRGLYAAVTRKGEDGKKEYFPEEKLAIDQAIAAYTTGSAFAEFAEKEKGTLAPGMLADFVVLDRDITAVASEKILGTKVLRTVVGGKTVYEVK